MREDRITSVMENVMEKVSLNIQTVNYCQQLNLKWLPFSFSFPQVYDFESSKRNNLIFYGLASEDGEVGRMYPTESVCMCLYSCI